MGPLCRVRKFLRDHETLPATSKNWLWPTILASICHDKEGSDHDGVDLSP